MIQLDNEAEDYYRRRGYQRCECCECLKGPNDISLFALPQKFLRYYPGWGTNVVSYLDADKETEKLPKNKLLCTACLEGVKGVLVGLVMHGFERDISLEKL